MRVMVRFLGQLGQFAGAASQVCDVDVTCSVQDLLLRLGAERGGDFERLLLSEGGERVHPSILIFRGGTQVTWERPTMLSEDDEIVLSPPIAGG